MHMRCTKGSVCVCVVCVCDVYKKVWDKVNQLIFSLHPPFKKKNLMPDIADSPQVTSLWCTSKATQHHHRVPQ